MRNQISGRVSKRVLGEALIDYSEQTFWLVEGSISLRIPRWNFKKTDICGRILGKLYGRLYGVNKDKIPWKLSGSIIQKHMLRDYWKYLDRKNLSSFTKDLNE